MTLIARAVLRRRWLALLALGFVAGLAGATVSSAAALARRSGTAYERLERETAPGDVTLFVPAGEAAAERAAKLPGVKAAWVAHSGVAARGESTKYVGVLAGPTPPRGVFRPIPVEGRLPHPAADDEVMINERLVPAGSAERKHLLGSRLPLHFLTPEQFRSFDTGIGAPEGPRIDVTVVGVVRLAGRPEGVFSVVASPGFAAAHPDAVAVGPTVYIALKKGAAGVPRFLAELDRLKRGLAPPKGAEEFNAFEVVLTSEARTEVDATASTLVTGLAVFAVVAGLSGLLVVGQAFGRYHALTAPEQQTESALGLTRLQRAGARTLAATVAAAVAAAITAVGTVVAGGGEPIGALSTYEPSPGRSVNIAVVAAGAASTALLVLAAAGTTAWLAGRTHIAVRRTRRATWVDRLGCRPAAMGARFVTGAGTDGVARVTRFGLAGAIVGIAGIVGALVFDASLARLVDTPARYGWSGDFAIVDSRPEIDQEVLADKRVAAATRYRTSTVRVEGATKAVALLSGEHLRGRTGWWMVDGREPRARDEVTLGLRLADELGVEVGDTISVGSGRSKHERVSVVGTGVEPPFDGHRFGSALLMTPNGFDHVAQTKPLTDTLVRAARPDDIGRLVGHYRAKYELNTRQLPRDVDNLRQIERFPALLGGFLAITGFAALANAVVLAERRRRRDLAVLRALGYTARQSAAAVITMAAVIAVLALAVGVPLGIAAGRFLWHLVARDASVGGDALIPALSTLAASGGALVAAVLVATLPARRAATSRPAALLRAE